MIDKGCAFPIEKIHHLIEKVFQEVKTPLRQNL
jgi:hypothetical protein